MNSKEQTNIFGLQENNLKNALNRKYTIPFLFEGDKKEKNRLKLSDQHFLKKNDEIAKLYSDIPEALENNYNFHLRFNFKPKKSKPILPSIINESKISPEDELFHQARKGLENRIKNFTLVDKINFFVLLSSPADRIMYFSFTS